MAKPTTEKPAKPVEEDSDSDSSDDEDYVPDAKDDIPSDGDDDMDDSDTEQGNYTGGAEYSTSRSGKRRALDGGDYDGASHKNLLENTVDEAEAQRKKAKLDALWAELNTPAPKPGARPELLAAFSTLGSLSSGGGGASEGGSGKMVTITTTYDFAGETVTVTKDVPENSKEAKDYFRKKNKEDGGKETLAAASSSSSSSSSISQEKPEKPSTISSLSSTSLSTSTSTTTAAASSTTILDPKVPSASEASHSSTLIDSPARKPVRYVRRKSMLDALAATYGVKKPAKMNTLEKSKLDWNVFVGKEGIEDELKHHNKDGYMEKVAFLQRTDERRDQEYQLLKKKK